jgi:hypothetical protein
MSVKKNVVSKITPKVTGVDPKRLLGLAADVTSLDVAIIGGIANSVKTKEDTRNGSLYEFIAGTFRAINPETGEEFNSGVLYLPAGIHDLIAEPLRQGGATGLEFMLKLKVVRATNAVGYSWQGELLNEVAEASPLDRLFQSVADKLPQLAAPAETKAKK